MSEVFADSPNDGNYDTSTAATAADPESQRMTTLVVENEASEPPVNQSDNNNKKSAPTTTATKKGVSSFFLNYTNIVTLMIVISMFIAGIYGILHASGALDDENTDNSNKSLLPVPAVTAPITVPIAAVISPPTPAPVLLLPTDAPIAPASTGGGGGGY